ncbi:MAG TPA: PEP-CTERM sorting domain-containing protein [Planctomycetota bacterium]|nr:PEP-CTERM sorting domain-containing protein [Planctomycetota bacterium]
MADGPGLAGTLGTVDAAAINGIFEVRAPEPGTIVLLVGGLACLVGCGR